MAYQWLRAMCYLNRFGTLPRVVRAFQGLASETLVKRSLFGHGISVDVSRSTAQQLLLVEGERFVDERHLLRRLLRPGMTAVDVGANIGYYLLLLQQKIGPTGRAICIEPSIENLPELRRTISDNGFRNVDLHAVALGDHEGSIGFRAGINGGVSDPDQGAAHVVRVCRLDELIKEPIHFLKVDVEGYEGQVLAGAESLLHEHRPILFLELHPHMVGAFGFTVRAILDSLSRHYSRITLYEKYPLGEQSLLDKLALRYGRRDPLRVIPDADAYVARSDSGKVTHTFWAVCEP